MNKGFLIQHIATVIFLLSSHAVVAAPIISEVYPQPSDGPEWVELYNPDDTSHDLSGWTLFDQLASPSKIFEFTNQVIQPGEYFVAQLPTMKLNNSADGVVLFDSSSNEIDAMQYEASSLGKSWSRISAESGVFVQTDPTLGARNNITPSPSPSPTPTSTPPTPTPQAANTPSPTATASAAINPDEINIAITQLYPCPSTGEQEWAELQNQSDQHLDLTNWRLRDAQNNFRSLSGSLDPGEEKRFSWTQAMLNNAGDELFVETSSGETVVSASYAGCSKGEIIYPNQDAAPNQASHSNTETTLGTTTLDTDLSLALNQASSNNPASPSSTTKPITYQLPDLSLDQTSQLSLEPTTGLAIFTHPPPENLAPGHFLSVILGGLSISASGLLLLYEPKIIAFLLQLS